MCRSGYGPSRKAPRADTQVRRKFGVKRTLPQRGGTEPAPYRCAAGSAQQRADVPRAWLPPAKFRNGIWGVSHGHRPLRPAGDEGQHAGSSCPTGGCGEPPQLPWVAAHSGASAARMGGMGGDRSRDHPKGTINAGQSLSQPAADSSLYTREPLGRGMRIAITSAPNFGTKFGWRWLHPSRVGPAGLLAMTMVFCHSEERSDVGIRPFYDGRGFGPPSRRPLRKVYRSPSNGPMYLRHGLRRPNFVPKFGASVRASAPTESPINHPSQPARSEAPAPAAARNGRESALEPSKRDKLPRLPGQRLAKRKARKEQLVKFGFCPMTSECSTAHNVRKSQQSPARAPVGITSTEQDRLEPRPAARQGAPRP